MASLTALQLLVGLVIASILAIIVAPSTSSCNDRSKKYICCIKTNSTNGMSALIGFLHYCGCLFTNLGFAYGSASIVQVVKLLEPVETLLLVSPMILNANHGRVTPEKVISVLVIVAGTSLLLFSNEMKLTANIHTIIFAVLSGFAMSSRNIAEKTASGGQLSLAKGPKDWRREMFQGLNEFIKITIRVSIFSFLALLVSAGFVNTENLGMHSLLISMGLQAIVFHGLYNMASLSVLSLVSAQFHSLLNVVKRIIVNVTVVALVLFSKEMKLTANIHTILFAQPLGAGGALGLFIAAIGGIMYSKSGTTIAANRKRMQGNDGATTSQSHGSKYIFIGQKQMKAIALMLTMLLVFGIVHLVTPKRKDGEHNMQNSLIARNAMVDPKNPVWPKVAPTIRNDCDDRMSLCHILPWANFGDELGPSVVK